MTKAGALVLDVVQVAALRALSEGRLSAALAADITTHYPHYENKHLARWLRMLAHLLEKESDDE